MKPVLIVFAILLSVRCYSQEDPVYMRWVDSTLGWNSHEKTKELRIKRKDIKGSYRFSQQTKQLKSISFKEKQGRIHWVYYYNFIDNKLVMIRKWNSYRSYYGDAIWASYYLKEGVVVYKKENYTQIENLEEHIIRALELQSESPVYK